MPFENPSIMSEEPDSSSYFQANVYKSNYSFNSKETSCCAKFWRCLCCRAYQDEINSPEDNSTSALVSASRKSYTVNQAPPSSRHANQDDLPKLIVTRPIDDEFPTKTQSIVSETKTIEDDLAKSTTKLLLATEKQASSISLSSPKIVQRKQSTSVDSNETNSRKTTLKSGEKISFLQEVLSCRDSFLRSLEWCDNSLTRGKRCRTIKKDDWIELNDGDGI